MLCVAFNVISLFQSFGHTTLMGQLPCPAVIPLLPLSDSPHCCHHVTTQQILVYRCLFAFWTPVLCLKGILQRVRGICQVRSMVAVCAECAQACAGINTAIYSPSGANSGVGFAIPVDIVRSSVDQIIRFGRVIRPILGISFAPDQSSEQASVTNIHEVHADKVHAGQHEVWTSLCCSKQ